MKLYVSGPLNGNEVCPDRETNKINMNQDTEFLRATQPNHTFVNPLEVEPYCTKPDCGKEDGHEWQCWMRADIIAMMDCDGIVMIKGYEYSKGATAELNIACSLDFKVFHLHNGQLVPV